MSKTAVKTACQIAETVQFLGLHPTTPVYNSIPTAGHQTKQACQLCTTTYSEWDLVSFRQQSISEVDISCSKSETPPLPHTYHYNDLVSPAITTLFFHTICIYICHRLHNFPGGFGLAGIRMTAFWILLELKMMEVVVTTGAMWRAKLQSNRHRQQTDTQFWMPFLSPNQ